MVNCNQNRSNQIGLSTVKELFSIEIFDPVEQRPIVVLGSCIVFGFILGHVIVESSKLLKIEKKKKKKEDKSSCGTAGTVCCQDEGKFSIIYIKFSFPGKLFLFLKDMDLDLAYFLESRTHRKRC